MSYVCMNSPQYVLCIAVLCNICAPVDAEMSSPQVSYWEQVSYREPVFRDPDIAWENDPDLEAIDDSRIVQLWHDTVVSYRCDKGHDRGLVRGLYRDSEYTALGLSQENTEYLITTLEKELKRKSVNWNKVRSILLILMAGTEMDDRIPKLANYLFKMERPIKMSVAHGLAYLEMLQLLSLQHTASAAEILYLASQSDYWGDGPLYSPWLSKNNREESIKILKSTSISMLTKLPATLCLQWLEKLSQEYEVVVSKLQNQAEEVNNPYSYKNMYKKINKTLKQKKMDLKTIPVETEENTEQ